MRKGRKRPGFKFKIPKELNTRYCFTSLTRRYMTMRWACVMPQMRKPPKYLSTHIKLIRENLTPPFMNSPTHSSGTSLKQMLSPLLMP